MGAGMRYAVAAMLTLTIVAGAVGLSAGQTNGGASRGSGSGSPHQIVRELPELRTRSTRTYLTSAGTNVTRLWTGSVNYRDGGTWREIDNELERDANGLVRNRANRYALTLPADLAAQAVRLSADDASLAFRLQAAHGTPELAGAAATYRNALPDIDVRYDAQADGVKETLSLRSPEAAREFRFDLSFSDNLTVERAADGGLELKDEDGDIRFAIPAPVAWDAVTEDAPSTEVVEMTYVPRTQEVVLRASDAYVDDPDREFPISIDPWVTLPTDGRDCTLSARSDEQGTSFCSSTSLHMGTVASPDNHDHTAVVDFDAAERLPEHITILESFATMYVKTETGTAWHEFAAHALARPFVVNEVSWLRASAATAWQRPGGDFNPTPAHLKWMGGGGANKKTFWPMPDQVQRWADGTEADWGLIFRPTAPNPPYGAAFGSTEETDPTRRPYLDVGYEPIQGNDGPFSFVYEPTSTSEPAVNVASGRLLVRDDDATVSTAGPGLAITRYYNSADPYCCSTLGMQWRLGAAARIQRPGNGDVSVQFPSGTWARFPRNPDGTTYGPDRSVDATLVKTATGFTVERGDGERFLFDSNNRLVRREQTGVTGAVTYAYDAAGKLTTITDAEQRLTRLGYNTAGKLSTVTLPDGRVITYAYTSGGMLQSRTFAGATTSYEYESGGKLKRVKTPTGNIKASYDAKGRVISFTRVTNPTTDTGLTTQFAYHDKTSLGACPAESAGRTVETSEDGVITYCWDERLEVIETTYPGTESPVVEEMVADGYADRHSVSIETAKVALDTQGRATGLGEVVSEGATEAGYGGVWFDHGDRHMKVGLTPATDATPVQNELAARGLTNRSDIVRVPHTQGKLIIERDRILNQVLDLVTREVVAGGFRANHNDVLIEVAASITAAERSRVNAAVAGATVPVTVRQSTEQSFNVEEYSCGGRSCDPPMRGGVGMRLTNPFNSIFCTTGFIGRLIAAAPNNTPHVLTAGHCNRRLSLADEPARVPRGGDNDLDQDRPWNLLGFLRPGWYETESGDFGLIGINENSPYRSRLVPWIRVTGNDKQGPKESRYRTRSDPSYRIHTTSGNQAGTSICITGWRSGTKCGEIDDVGFKRDDKKIYFARGRLYRCDDDFPHNDALRKGDSGGPVFIRGSARGIFAGGPDGPDDVDATCEFYYSGAREAECQLNFDILPVEADDPPCRRGG